MIFSSRASFRYPIEPAPRTAVLVSWFKQGWFRRTSVRVFPQGWCEEAASFVPAAIAANRNQLFELAAASIQPTLTHAVIVLSRPDDPLLSEADRHHLWRAFGVPIFEQIIGAKGEVLAAECEAHNGLHSNADFLCAGFSIDQTPCACGRTTPRLSSKELARNAAAWAH